MEILNSLWESICSIFTSSGLATLSWENYVMMCISFILLYLAIKKQYEPLLLLPIAFGMLLVNVFPGIMANPTNEMLTEAQVLARNLDPASYTTLVQPLRLVSLLHLLVQHFLDLLLTRLVQSLLSVVQMVQQLSSLHQSLPRIS